MLLVLRERVCPSSPLRAGGHTRKRRDAVLEMRPTVRSHATISNHVYGTRTRRLGDSGCRTRTHHTVMFHESSCKVTDTYASRRGESFHSRTGTSCALVVSVWASFGTCWLASRPWLTLLHVQLPSTSFTKSSTSLIVARATGDASRSLHRFSRAAASALSFLSDAAAATIAGTAFSNCVMV